ncbi:FAD-binding oxidoreductase [Nocardia sp. NBC_00881]|uniref:FAD-binding oxidoreductase n=1 Tax=Nocardia sp. NBC_00881 TaxID=2975995 RepID=UPI003869A41C|nr:FAD-binding oxidoreductase [Nocardia sp. NBC_00881]
MTTTLPLQHLDELRAACRGPVLIPGDIGYDTARHMWNAAVDPRPAAGVRCADIADVRAAVEFSRRRGLAVSLRGGGHDVARHPAADGSILLDLSPLANITVDAATRRAVVAPGVTWAEFDHVCQAHGLAVTGADVSTVGVIGTALVGGSGWLQRACGFTCDNIRSAEIVLADGSLVRVDDDNHPDLLWALRGGGGNFGVVVSLELELHPVTTVFAGTLLYRYDAARRVFDGFREFSATVPDEVALRTTLLNWPPNAPHGPPMVAITAAYLGPAADARAISRQLRRIGEPELDLMRPLNYPELQHNTEQAFNTGHSTATGTEWLRTLDDHTVDALIALGRRMPTQHSLVSVHQLGGALRRTPADTTAFAYHHAAYHMVLFSGGPAGQDLGPSRRWIAEIVDTVQECSAGGPYIGILDGSCSPQRVRSAYHPDDYRRLAAIKAAYDPDNVFRCNHNIPPVSLAGGRDDR